MHDHAMCRYKHLKAKVVANVAVLVEQVLATPNVKTELEIFDQLDACFI